MWFNFDYTPVLLTLGTTVIKKPKKQNFTNKCTDWNKFREALDDLIILQVRVKTIEELELQLKNFIEHIRAAVRQATPAVKEVTENEINYPSNIRDLIGERRKTRRVRHRTRNKNDKREPNRISNRTRQSINEYNQCCFKNYINGLNAEADSEYSLWKATSRFKRPIVHVPPIKNVQNQWVKKQW